MSTPIPKNEASFTIQEIADATFGRVVRGDPGHRVQGVVIDSRQAAGNTLFVAIEGARHDAHRFLPEVVEAGVGAVVVREGSEVPPGPAVVEVKDTTVALGALAAFHRRRFEIPVFAVTGSAGKTSTKDLTSAAFSALGARVLATHGNLNNLIGLPMMVFCLGPRVDLAVFELGTSQPGEIGRLAQITRPDVGVVTLVAAAHTEGLGSVELVAEEKAGLLMSLTEEGVAVFNAEDRAVRSRAERSAAGRRILFGRADEADVRIRSWSIRDDLRTECTFDVRGVERPVSVRMQMLGEAAALNAAAALAVVMARGGDIGRAIAGLERVAPTPGRMQPLRGQRDSLVIDDTYNANPRSTELALETLVRIAKARKARAVAVLGDMRELGVQSHAAHEAIGRYAASQGVWLLVCAGAEMAAAARVAESAGVEVVRADHAKGAIDPLMKKLTAGDVVLVKGSRSMGMERIVQKLVGKSGKGRK